MMKLSGYLVCVCFLCFVCSCYSQWNYEDMYKFGMKAYKKEQWTSCVKYFKSALMDYHSVRNVLVDCRLQCVNISSDKDTTFPSYTAFFHDILLSSDCLRRCKKKKLQSRSEEEISFTTEKKFEDRQPYNYIQFCYFKTGNLKDAAAAAYTYYITHQTEKRILDNLQFYRELDEIAESDFVDLERKPYQKAYIRGLMAYNDGQWEKSTAQFEEALSLYYVEEERCRAGCHRGFGHTGLPEFTNAVADHYITVIVCQQRCLKSLSIFGMQELDNFVAEHYNYLQFAYFQENNLKKASESISSYLLFRPKDQEMLTNMQYYIDILNFSPDDFVPSADAVKYVNLWKEVDTSLDFIRDHYLLPNDQLPVEESSSDDKTIGNNGPKEYERLEKFSQLGITLFAEEDELHGNERFAADNMIREDQCQALADLARSQKPDDHGIRKIGIQESLIVVSGDMDFEVSLRLFVRASDVLAAYASSYFNTTALIQDAHVVCSDPDVVKLLSSCILQEDGLCRIDGSVSDYIVLVYLTSPNVESGFFSFTDLDDNVQISVLPECGRIVGFSTNNQHLVQPSTVERCALVTYLTLDERQKTPDFRAAVQMLSFVEEKRKKDWQSVDGQFVLEQFLDQGVKIVMEEKELMGKERFSAEGLSTEEECEQLIKLAQQQGLSGDGYHGNVSPHTERELFHGLEVKRLSQIGGIVGDGYVSKEEAILKGNRYVSPYTKAEHFKGLNISHMVKLMDQGVVSSRDLHLLLDVSDNTRLLVEKYFNLDQQLFFDYTHLVCRTAVEDPDKTDDTGREIVGETETDGRGLSHPVHSDNCMIQPDGTCIVDPQAFKQRHYSAILYLNDNFEGGEFFFAHKNKSEQVSIAPKCGQIVAFNAGEYHGVKAVRSGQRCAIAMWYTHDVNYMEVSRIHARRQLDRLAKNHQATEDGILPPEALSTNTATESSSRDEL